MVLNLAFFRTPGVDEPRGHPLHGGMPRFLRPLPFAFAALALALTGCRTSTPYTAMYSPRKGYYKAPPPKAEKSAEELLSATEASKPGGLSGALPGGPPPADAGAIPGLPPAAAPAADPLAPPPAAPAN